MRIVSLLFILNLIIIPFVIAQERSSNELEIFATKYGRDANPKYNDLKGSPYLEDDFIIGELETTDGEVIEVNLRLNVFANELEFETTKGIKVLKDPEQMSRILLGESEYIFLESSDPLEESAGYFKRITGDKCMLLTKHRIIYMSSVAAGAYEPAKKAELRKEPDSYYLSLSTREIVKLKRKKKFIFDLFPDQQESINRFLKVEKISLMKENDLIELVDFLNSVI